MAEDPISIIPTSDGSVSLYHAQLGETYHSRHGAIQESMHVFIGAGLSYSITGSRTETVVFEIGFGTGLNAALAMRHAIDTGHRLVYHTIEKFPLSPSQQQAYLLATPLHIQDYLKPVVESPWETQVLLSDPFALIKYNADALEKEFPACDVLFMDAFAPAVSPELWTPTMMQKYFDCLHPEGILVTYCAKGEVRRNLEQVGFCVERIPGPPGKREMLRAIKPQSI